MSRRWSKRRCKGGSNIRRIVRDRWWNRDRSGRIMGGRRDLDRWWQAMGLLVTWVYITRIRLKMPMMVGGSGRVIQRCG